MAAPGTRLLVLFSSLALLVVGFGVGSARPSTTAGPRDLPHIRIDGATRVDQGVPGGLAGAGISVAGAGDVNGDRRPDVIVGAPREGNNGRPGSGSAHVVFGQPQPGTVDLANLGTHGFRIDGARPGELAGLAVSGAGDVNGDGRPDLIVGAPGPTGPSDPDSAPIDSEGQPNPGKAYVVFGKGSAEPVDLAKLGDGGFEIVGRRFIPPDGFGFTVAGAGDVNGDRRADVIVAAPGDPGFEDTVSPASVYVVYGSASSGGVRVGGLGRRGFQIAPARTPGSNLSVAGAGDVNGDRRADLIIGDDLLSLRRDTQEAAHVVFGARYRSTVRLNRLGRRGFSIRSAQRRPGLCVAGAGDVNGDGLADVVVGSPRSGGAAYVVFGKRSPGPVDLVVRSSRGLKRLGRNGFRMIGSRGDVAGCPVAGAGRVNGDRRSDIVLAGGRSVHVVFGKGSGSQVRLRSLGRSGLKIDGLAYEPLLREPSGAVFGGFGPVAGAGDVNGDGRADMLVGAPSASHNGRRHSGSAYVFFSP